MCPLRVCRAFFGSRAFHTFTVLSLLALAMNALSADHDTWYTDPTWPVRVDRKVPVRPHQSFTFLSKEADAMYLVSGEKAMWFTSCWCPVIRTIGVLSSCGFQRNSVKSSDPDTSLSPSGPMRAWYLSRANCCDSSGLFPADLPFRVKYHNWTKDYSVIHAK